jgi:proteasome assembly chaperone (PAC2) family protein
MASNFPRLEGEEGALVPGAAGLAGQLSDHTSLKEVGLYGLIQGYVYQFSFLENVIPLIMKGYRAISAVFVF